MRTPPNHRFSSICTFLLLPAGLFLAPAESVFAAPLSIDWVDVGDAGNFGGPVVNTAFGPVTLGAVNYEYRIGKYEVTNTQYAAFLNAKAATDTYSLYNANMGTNIIGGIDRSGVSGSYTYSVKAGYENMPVVYVSWYDAARFANWMHNGQGNGATETGAYTLTPGSGDPAIPGNVNTLVARNPGALYALPSEDEWYKAAYYDPNKNGPGQSDYWTYATASDTLPTSGLPSSFPSNGANYFSPSSGYAVNGDMTTGAVPSGVLFLTEVGAYTDSASSYGTFDQLGSLWEWNEGYYGPGATAAARGTMGGSYTTPQGGPQNYLGLSASRSTIQNLEVGFRLVTFVVPEPSTAVLALVGFIAVARVQRKRGR